MLFHPLMMSRLNKVAELQEYRNFDCEGTRELMGFVFYNTAVQIYSREDARERLDAFNARFAKPLPASELGGIVSSVDNVVNVKGERGHYVLRAHKLADLLALTDKEMEDLQFFASKRMAERMEAKRRTSEKRQARDELIVGLYKVGNKTQKQVAEAVGCCLRTVKTVLKKAGLTRRCGAPAKGARSGALRRIAISHEGFASPSALIGRSMSDNSAAGSLQVGAESNSCAPEGAKKWLTCLKSSVGVADGIEPSYFSVRHPVLKSCLHEMVLERLANDSTPPLAVDG